MTTLAGGTDQRSTSASDVRSLKPNSGLLRLLAHGLVALAGTNESDVAAPSPFRLAHAREAVVLTRPRHLGVRRSARPSVEAEGDILLPPGS